jgi:hypothetical protein
LGGYRKNSSSPAQDLLIIAESIREKMAYDENINE